MKSKLRAFDVGVKGTDWHTVIHHQTAGKAKYRYLLHVQDAWDGVSFKNLTCRAVGPCESLSVRRVAISRGLPFARIGMRIICDGHYGRIVGANDSSNFEVLFDDGHCGNCHPHWKMTYLTEDGEVLGEF